MATSRLRVLLTLVDKASSPLKKFGGVLSSIGKIAAGNLLAGFGRDATRAMGQAAKSAVSTGVDFEHAMAQVRASLQGISDGAMKTLELRAREMGSTTVFTALQAADAMETFAKAGLSAQQVFEAIEPALNLAAAGQLSIGQAADTSTALMNQFGLAVKDLTDINDLLAKTANKSKTDVAGLAQAFSFAGDIASTLGVDMTEVATAIGLLVQAGIPAQRAGRGLAGVLVEIVKGESNAEEQTQGLGIEIKKLANGNFGLIDAFRQMDEAGLTATDALAGLSRMAGRTAASLINKGVPAMEEFDAALRDRLGFSAAVAEDRLDSLKGETTLLNSALTELKIAVASNLIPVFRQIVEATTKFIQGLAQGVDDAGSLRQSAISLAIVILNAADSFIVITTAVGNLSIALVRGLVSMAAFSGSVRAALLPFQAFFRWLKETGEGLLEENETVTALRETIAGLIRTLEALREVQPITPEDLANIDAAKDGIEGLVETVRGSTTEYVSAQNALQTLAAEGVLGLTQLLIVMENGVRQANREFEKLGDIMARNIRGVAINAAFSLGDALVDAAFGAKISFKEFFRQFFIDIAKAIVQAIILKAILAGFGAGAGAGAPVAVGGGGIVGAQGGFLPAGIGSANRSRDSVPALLTPGEAVLPVELTDFLLEAAAGGPSRGQDIAITIESDIPSLVTKINRRVRNRSISLEASKLILSRGSV